MRELVVYEGKAASRPAFVARVLRVFSEHLTKNGLRLTGQRRAILDLFLTSDHHLSQEEIYEGLRAKGIGRATVFRTLKTLEECGLVDHVIGTDGIPRFEVKSERPHHDHLICISCGRIQEVRWPRLEKIQEKTCRQLGFLPHWHRHEIFGRCQNCRRNS